MSFFQQLVEATSAEQQTLMQLPVIQETFNGQVSVERYHRFLTLAYQHVKHTVPLLMACGSRLQSHQQWLQKAIAEYIEEEVGHEEWILNDIRAAGGNVDAVATANPDFPAEVMVAYAYDLISRKNPIGFFGMVHVLEGTSIALATNAAGIIKQELALPNKAFSYLLSHGDLDISQLQFFQQLMDKVENIEDQNAIINGAKIFYRLYGDVLSAAY